LLFLQVLVLVLVLLYQNDRFVTSYPIAIGKPGWETPTGYFQVMQMLKNPTWQNPLQGTIVPPGKENPLGDRWIAFWTDGKNCIGFHGTPNEQTVGTPASHGCIRMKNKDIRELFDRVTVGTTVLVEN
jgi:L,D-transpeptidase ErfK/SrfK